MRPQTIRVQITDESGKHLNGCEYNLALLEQAIKKNHRNILFMRDVAFMTRNVADMAWDAIRAGLQLREDARQAPKKNRGKRR